MIRFLIKKTFYDFLDNAFILALLNLIFLVLSAIPFLLPHLFEMAVPIKIAVFICGLFICSWYGSIVLYGVSSISDYKTFSFKHLKDSVKKTPICGICITVLLCFVIVSVNFILPFYLLLDSMPAFIFASLVFWLTFFAIVTFQFFLSVRLRLNSNIIETIKKCFIIFFDNKCFCIFCFFCGFTLIVFSVITGFLFPGPAGLILFFDEALRLRLLKYDTEKTGSTKILWNILLKEECEKTPHRSLRTIFFPWKD
ncbi:MAG: hypothetical protein LBV52_02100 [Spirochaetaceae bacterium]|jgi:hypothetical protein|nr:hypothetical protein [Spirochaetaceae bacterium]